MSASALISGIFTLMSRYSRQELFAGIGKEGQAKLRQASVAIIGCGALGSLQSETLTRAGIGSITIIDRDFVEPSNLQRQALFTEADAAQSIPKAVAAADHLRAINSEIQINAVVSDLAFDNLSIVPDVQLILDGTDNFQTRYLLNDLAWKRGVPWIYGACVGATGVASAFIPQDSSCLRCIFETEPPVGSAQTCDTAGIIWPAVAAVVSYQISSALKILSGKEVKAEFFQVDVWENRFHTISVEKAKRGDCPTCVLRQYPSLQTRLDFETSLCGRDAVQIRPHQKMQIDLDAIFSRWQKIGEAKRNPFLAKLLLADNEIVLFPDGRAIIKGTHDFHRARDLYAKYVGS